MIKKLITALIVSPMLFVVPALGNLDAVAMQQLWILVGVGVMASIYQPSYDPMDRTAPQHDKGTAKQIVWSVYLTQIVGVIEAVYFRYPQSFVWDYTSSAALVVIAIGFFTRTFAVRELGKYFTWHITVQTDQNVITTGPYRFMRHPAYTGGFLMYTFTLVFIHAWYSVAFGTIAMLLAFSRRIKYEEIWLVKNMGKAYEDYTKSVKSLIPYVY